MSLMTIVPFDNCSTRQLFLSALFLAIIIPPFLYKSSFTKRTVLQMTKIKGTEEQELLQTIIWMIRPPLFLCKWSFAKRTVLTKTKGMEEHGGGRIIPMIICNKLCSSVPLILVIWRTVLFTNDHLYRNGGIIVARNNCRKGHCWEGH